MNNHKILKKGYVPLTIDVATTLIGKPIDIVYEYKNSYSKDNITIGGIKTKYEMAASTILENGKTKTEMSESFGWSAKIRAMKDTLCLVDNNGDSLYIISKKSRFVNQDNGKTIFYKVGT